ncbi:MAG TPA: bifunctional shikimate kinase/3-dehydroquinate synthase [Candidatus Kapabacteria bacterium]|nr:bifunctional shikimate kinase/3-dehydroquinate synthase [Candidatus Kapabacteria bacterium]
MTWHNRNLYLIGLPGAGKSAIGRELSALLDHYAFVDLDSEIERIAGESIATIFSSRGEASFRELETAALLEAASWNGKPRIIATGGGVVLSSLNRAILRGSGIPIWIDVTVKEAAKNVLNDILQGRDRPLFRAASPEELRGKLSGLLSSRRAYYEQATLHFVLRDARGEDRTTEELAHELITALDEMSFKVLLAPRHRTLIARSALRTYPILVGNGIAARELSHLVRDRSFSRLIVVMDKQIDQLHWPALREKLQKELGLKVVLREIVIEGGEVNKNIDTLTTILSSLNENGAARRTTLLVAFGGGVVTDIAGLAASLYHRGLPLVHIPTTLIAQADAAIGGKTGIDHFGRKNAIGTFYPPLQVIVDPIYLKTLPKRERLAGLAEVFKYTLIGNPELWKKLTKSVRRLVRGVDAAYEEVIYDSIVEKLRYVESDEFERLEGVRELLNFGHTFGHALEAASDFAVLRHGEAVLLGMRAASWLSKELGHLTETEWAEIELVLGRIPIASEIDATTSRIFEAFRRDKKGQNRVILLRSIGEAFVTEISDTNASKAIDYMLTLV